MESWIPSIVSVIVAVIAMTIESLVTTGVNKAFGRNTTADMKKIKSQVNDSLAVETTIMQDVKNVKDDVEKMLKENKDILANIKDEREENAKVLAEIKEATENMISIKNELNAIKKQNQRDLRVK